MSDSGPKGWCRFAREVIQHALAPRDSISDCTPPPHEPHGGVFVTLYESDRLRGCMGVLDPHLQLAEAISRAARTAALDDPRFTAVTPEELRDVRIEVSVLSAPQPMRTLDELQVGQHGIIVRRGARRGLFLPQVAVDHGLDRFAFLSHCCAEKAGLPPDAWRDPSTEVLLFTTTRQAE